MFGSLVKHLNIVVCVWGLSAHGQSSCVGLVHCLCPLWFWPGWDTHLHSLYWNVLKNPFWQRNWDHLKRADIEGMLLGQVLVVNSSFALELWLWYWVSLQRSGSCRTKQRMNWTPAVPVQAVLCLPGHHIPLWCSHPTAGRLFSLWQLFIHVSVSSKVCFAFLPCCASTQTGNCSEKNWTSVVVITLGVCKQTCGELFH